MNAEQLREFLKIEIERLSIARDLFISKMNMDLGSRNGEIEGLQRVLGLLDMPMFDASEPTPANETQPYNTLYPREDLEGPAQALAENMSELARVRANGQASIVDESD